MVNKNRLPALLAVLFFVAPVVRSIEAVERHNKLPLKDESGVHLKEENKYVIENEAHDAGAEAGRAHGMNGDAHTSVGGEGGRELGLSAEEKAARKQRKREERKKMRQATKDGHEEEGPQKGKYFQRFYMERDCELQLDACYVKNVGDKRSFQCNLFDEFCFVGKTYWDCTIVAEDEVSGEPVWDCTITDIIDEGFGPSYIRNEGLAVGTAKPDGFESHTGSFATVGGINEAKGIMGQLDVVYDNYKMAWFHVYYVEAWNMGPQQDPTPGTRPKCSSTLTPIQKQESSPTSCPRPLYFTAGDKVYVASIDSSIPPTVLFNNAADNPDGAVGIDIDPTTCKLYWATGNHQDIRTGNVDGSSDPSLAFAGVLEDHHGVAVDSGNQRVFFTVVYNGVYVGDLGSSTFDLVASTPEAVVTVVYDASSGLLYYGGPGMDGIYAVNPDLSDPPVQLYTVNGVRDIALDSANNKIYWVDTVQVMVAPLDGIGSPSVLYGKVGDGTSNVRGITLDTANGEIYVVEFVNTNDYPNAINPNKIWKANADGIGTQAIIHQGSFGFSAFEGGFARGIVLGNDACLTL